MYLPGSIGELTKDLREMMNLSQKEFAKRAGISESKLSRIESGATKTIGSDALIKIATTLNVSTDYLLGLTTIRAPKQFDVERLGLSENAIARLLNNNFNTDILNRLIEHNAFPRLLALINTYFSGKMDTAMATRNDILESSLGLITGFQKENKLNTPEIYEDKVMLQSQKISKGEIELNQIRDLFISMLRDIRKDIESDVPTSPKFVKEMFGETLSQIKISEENGTQSLPTIDDVSEIIKNTAVSNIAGLNQEQVEMLGNFAKTFLESWSRQGIDEGKDE